MIKESLTAAQLIKRSKYPVTSNEKIINAVEDYCTTYSLPEDHKNNMLVFTGIIYEKMITQKEKRAEVPKEVFVKLFSSKKYSKIKHDCMDCTIDITRNPYQFGGYCTSYSVKNHLFDTNVSTYYPNLSKSVDRKFKKKLEEKYTKGEKADDLYGDNRVKIQNEFLAQNFDKFSAERVDRLSEKLKNEVIINVAPLIRNKHLFDAFRAGKHFVGSPDKNGRVYNIFTYCKREFRSLIGDEYVEVDIANSHPYILMNVLNHISDEPCTTPGFLDKLNKIEENHKRDSKALQFSCTNFYNNLFNLLISNYYPLNTLNYTKYSNNSICVHFSKDELIKEIKYGKEISEKGEFYTGVIEKYDLISQNNYDNLVYLLMDEPRYESNWMKLKGKKLDIYTKKKIIKKCFMFWLNGTPKGLKGSPPKMVFQKVFPNISLLMDHFKLQMNQKTCFHSLITTIESNFVFEVINQVYKETGSVVGSVHDAFFVERLQMEYFIKIKQRTEFDYFGSNPNFKIKSL